MDGYNAEAVAVTQVMAQQLKEARQSGNRLADLVLQMRAKIDEQNAEISKLRGQVAGDTMHIAGLEAARAAYMKQHPDSPLLRDSGQRFRDGDVKTNARLVYERAFDEEGRRIGIEEPAKSRQD